MNQDALRRFEDRCIADLDRILKRFEEAGIKKCEPAAGKTLRRNFTFFAGKRLVKEVTEP